MTVRVRQETSQSPRDDLPYRAANWEKIGMTAGHRGGSRTKPPKEIFVMPLAPRFRTVLKGERRPPKRPEPPQPPQCDDPFVATWMKIVDAASELALAHDRKWMRRRRVLNSLIVVLFVFRLVLSRGGKGYATVTAELWDQCRKLGIALPQRQPVAASSICKARARVHDNGIRIELPFRGNLSAARKALTRRDFCVPGDALQQGP